MAKYSEKQNKWTQAYIAKAYDDIKIRVPKGYREKYKAHAEAQGKSLNQLVIGLLEADVEDKEYFRFEVMDVIDGDIFNKGFNSKEEALEYAENEWEHHLTSSDKKRRQEFYVLECVNPDRDAVNHFDGNEVKRWK